VTGQVLTQIVKQTGTVDRVPRGETPVVELHLNPGQYIAGFELQMIRPYDDHERKTKDWRWAAYVVTPLP
jgi:hypothetical protein